MIVEEGRIWAKEEHRKDEKKNDKNRKARKEQ